MDGVLKGWCWLGDIWKLLSRYREKEARISLGFLRMFGCFSVTRGILKIGNDIGRDELL